MTRPESNGDHTKPTTEAILAASGAGPALARLPGDDVDELAAAYAAGALDVPPEAAANGARKGRGKGKQGSGGADAEPVETFDDVPDEPGHQVLGDVARWLGEHVAFASALHGVAVALWAAHTHTLSAAASTPRLAFLSPEPGSGKTRCLELLELIVRKGRHVLSMTPAALFRVVEAEQPTILLDEVDAIFGPKAKDHHEDLRALINAGHRPGATVMRVVGDGGGMRTHEFRAYCPVALAGLGQLPSTIASRSVSIPMRRRAPDEHVRPYRERITRPEGEALQRRLAAWAHRHGHEIPEAPTLPAGVTDRVADCWEPLIAIADAAGGRWPDVARDACTAIVDASRTTDEQSLGLRLLGDLRDAFGADHRLATSTLLARLVDRDDAPWGEMLDNKSDKARGSWLSRKLKPYAIAPRAVRIGDTNPRGYDAAQFGDVWRRWLPPPVDPDDHIDTDSYEAAYPDLFDTQSGEAS